MPAECLRAHVNDESSQVGNAARKEDETAMERTRLIYLHRFIATEEIISASSNVSAGITSTLNHDLIGPHRESITPQPFSSPYPVPFARPCSQQARVPRTIPFPCRRTRHAVVE